MSALELSLVLSDNSDNEGKVLQIFSHNSILKMQ